MACILYSISNILQGVNSLHNFKKQHFFFDFTKANILKQRITGSIVMTTGSKTSKGTF